MAITWTPTVEDRWKAAGKAHSRVKLVSSGTYTTGGDALPTFGNLGFRRNVEMVHVFDGSANGFVYKWDSATGKLKIFQGDNTNAAAAPLIELPNATSHVQTIYAYAIGW